MCEFELQLRRQAVFKDNKIVAKAVGHLVKPAL
jgi:hypothetical protein